MHVCDVMLVVSGKWPQVIVLDSGGRIYDACGPKHLTYRDAVIHWTGDCPAIQPVQPASCMSNAGESDRKQVITDLARMALSIFGCIRTNASGEQENITIPSHI